MEKNNEIDPVINDVVLNFEKAYSHLYSACVAWELSPNDFSVKLNRCQKYPFQGSLDEVVYSIGEYILELKEALEQYKTQKFEPTMTVGDLRKIISGMDDGIQIVLGNSNGWFNNIDSYEYPDGENYVALTLNIGDESNTRQF